MGDVPFVRNQVRGALCGGNRGDRARAERCCCAASDPLAGAASWRGADDAGGGEAIGARSRRMRRSRGVLAHGAGAWSVERKPKGDATAELRALTSRSRGRARGPAGANDAVRSVLPITKSMPTAASECERILAALQHVLLAVCSSLALHRVLSSP